VLSDTNFAGRTRSWTRFSQMTNEIVYARMWSGIHFLNPDKQGAELGEDVAKYREKHYFGRVHDDDEDEEEAARD